MRTQLRNFLAQIGFLRFIRQSWLWRLKNRQLYTVFPNDAMAAFWEVDRICKGNQIKIWPTLGTLLGIEREDGPLKHDLDLDFGVFFDIEAQERIRKEFLANDFKLIATCKLKSNGRLIEEKYNFLNIDVDIFYFIKEGEQCFFYDTETDSGLSIEEELEQDSDILPYKNVVTTFDLESRIFKDQEILFPTNIKNHLKELYGATYLIPDKQWRQNKRKNRYLIENDSVLLEVFRS